MARRIAGRDQGPGGSRGRAVVGPSKVRLSGLSGRTWTVILWPDDLIHWVWRTVLFLEMGRLDSPHVFQKKSVSIFLHPPLPFSMDPHSRGSLSLCLIYTPARKTWQGVLAANPVDRAQPTDTYGNKNEENRPGEAWGRGKTQKTDKGQLNQHIASRDKRQAQRRGELFSAPPGPEPDDDRPGRPSRRQRDR
ncbi:hypothetical protein Daes_0171 [Pseudodesulfovibrio aespoeensis Aspo-2]|uniref:Uncharacterized protein n=1 Tax=Pseudodesulfovibrio aespoeensis (strain ATCC 700646 / DSM 10631 / Aspo-2) TaxID=643562 RepID=E6VV47_PSEA9|nr:hypothetical protein Daes_0171 [Pseudodesulfovibrio aespoeensis Aspo-2]